jgi:hypothetical protein
LSGQKKEQINKKREQTNTPVKELSENQKEAVAKKTAYKEAQVDKRKKRTKKKQNKKEIIKQKSRILIK